MSLGTGDPASETGDDSLSAVTVDSDFEMKTKRKSIHKPPPTSPKSPYYSKPRAVASWRSLRTAASLPLSHRMTFTPQKLWPGSSKPGSLIQPPKLGIIWEPAWTHPPGSTPDHLTEALRTGRSHLRRSASNGHVPGTPVYREKEDMYDEIINLKKSLHMQKSDMDLLRTKLRRLEEENARKDRQIEQLLGASQGPDFVWTLAEKRPDTGWVVNGLKQRVLKLEQQCKGKDGTISKLQADLKSTNLEEMRITMETYYEEICRLQTLLASSETRGRKPPVEKRTSLRRQRKLNSTLLSLSHSVQELTEENQSLKEDLDRVLSNSPAGACPKDYVEWSKPRLLRRIAELEKKITSMEGPKPQAAEGAWSDPLALSPSSNSVHRQPGPEHCKDSDHLQSTVWSLKSEREALQAQLQERDLEVRQLLQAQANLQAELDCIRGGEKARREQEEALRKEIQALTKKFQDLAAVKKEEEEGPSGLTPETQEQPHPACPSSSPSQQHPKPEASEEGWSQPHSTCSEGRRHAAARILQAHWKVYRCQKKKTALDKVATVLQAAFRGHLARAKLIPSKVCGPESLSVSSLPSQNSPSPCILSPTIQADGDPEQEVAITIIQSVLRAHLARVRHSQRTCTAASTKKMSPLTPRSITCSLGPPAAPAGQEDTEVSGGDTVEGPAPQTRVPRSWGPRAPAASQTCPAESPPSRPQPSAPPLLEDGGSDDSDEVVMAPCLTVKKVASAPPALGPHLYVFHGDSLSGEG